MTQAPINAETVYSDTGPERGGIILPTGEWIELENVSRETLDEFTVSDTDLEVWLDRAVATWHTHPGCSSNLSVADYWTFRGYPELKHLIIGKDGISGYSIDTPNACVIRAEDVEDYSAWVLEKAHS